MEKSTTEAGVVPAAIVEEAWQQVGASFERFCLTAGIATLAGMMETDAARLCGTRYGMTASMAIVEGGPRESWASTEARSRWSYHACGPAPAGEIALPSWEAAMAEDWLGKWALNLMLINVSTCKFGRALRLPEGDVPAENGAGLSNRQPRAALSRCRPNA